MDEENGVPVAEEQEQEQAPDQRFLDQQKRAEKAEAEAKDLKSRLEGLQREEKPELPEREAPNQFDTLADNLSVLKPLETDEIEELRTEARSLGVDPIKFAQSKAWQAHLETLRANKQSEARTPEPSHRTAVFDGKTYADVVADESTTPETRQKAFEAQRDSLLRRGNNNHI